MKRCTKCKKWKALSKFSKFRSMCKKCRNNDRRKYYQTHKIKCLKQSRKYKQTHKTEVTKIMRNYRKTLAGCLRSRFYDMKRRCNNPNATNYKNYGGRGIKCLFKNADEFVDYVVDELKANPHGLQIDRIDNDGHYEKGNIRFVTHKENQKNKRKQLC